MDMIIERLSEIEQTAGSIVDGTAARKKALAEEMAEKTAAFDEALEKETAAKIEAIQKEKEADLNELLSKQTADSEAFLKQLEETYEDHHREYVQALFRKMVKG